MATRNSRSDSGGMESSPDLVDFGVSRPHESADATFTIMHAQSDALLTAGIVADNSQGRFRILSLKSYAETGDIEKALTDGSRPLKVSRGQRVEVGLRFYSLLPKGQDYFKAVLRIQDVDANKQWEPIQVHMIALVGAVATVLPPEIRILRGRRMSLPITVVSDAGPDTTVSYALAAHPDGISMTPLQVLLPRGNQVTASLELAVAPTALLGRQDVILESAAFDGKLLVAVKVAVDVGSLEPTLSCEWLADQSRASFESNQTLVNWGIVDSSETVLGVLPTAKLFRPEDQYEICSAIRQAEAEGTTIRALGSGWSFSDAVLPQPSAIAGATTLSVREAGLSGQLDEESLRNAAARFSSSFGFAIDTGRLARSLQEQLPRILAGGAAIESLFFTEAGITIHALNEQLNRQAPPLALTTMGGAAGQTIAGAISTGTHGGDFDRAPLADSVRAIYLVGKGGAHYWIERSDRLTDPDKIQAEFPCIKPGDIHYNDDYFRAVLVSMGGMGIIYAVILDVVPRYSLLQRNKWSTWERLRAEQANVGFAGLFDGSWSGLTDILALLGIQSHSENRFVQVVINPIRNDDGTHNCYVSNRVELPAQERSGRSPLSDYTRIDPRLIRDAITSDPHFGAAEALNFHFHGPPEEGELLDRMRNLLAFCKRFNYSWAVRAVIDLIMRKTFPESNTQAGGPIPDSRRPPRAAVEERFQPEPGLVAADQRPQIDLSFRVMAPGGASRAFPILGATSVEPAFSFFPRPDHPGNDVIPFIDSVLAMFDAGMPPPALEGQLGRMAFEWEGREIVFPAGWLSLRVTGKTDALLGMQRFDLNGLVELSLIGNADDYDVVRSVERLALDMGGALHWGQSNGLMTYTDVEAAYGASNIAKWREAQQEFGGETFANVFMQRCGLVPTPIVRLDPPRITFDRTPVGDVRIRTLRIMNIGSSPLQVTLPASLSGPFRWAAVSALIPVGGVRDEHIQFMPQSAGQLTRTLLLQSNAPEGAHPVALSGRGYQSAPGEPPVHPL